MGSLPLVQQLQGLLASGGSGHLSPSQRGPCVLLQSPPPGRSGSACLEVCPRLPAALGPGRLANTVKLWCQCQSKVQPLPGQRAAVAGSPQVERSSLIGALLPPVMHAEGMFEVPQKMGKGTKPEGIPRQAGLEDLAAGRAIWSCAKHGKGSSCGSRPGLTWHPVR